MPFFPTLRIPGFGARRTAPPAAPAGRGMSVTERKLLLADYYAGLLNAGIGLHDSARPWPVERAVAEGYDRVVWCRRAVATIAENSARDDVPFEVVTGDIETPDVVEDHPVARLLNGTANEMESGKVFRERLAAQLKLSKRGVFIEVSRSNAGTPIRYDLLPPGRTRIVPGYTAMIDHFEVTRLDGSTYAIEPERVRWLRVPHPLDPYSGITPLEAAGLSMELDYFARLYNVSFLRNDARPGGVLAVEGDLDEDDMDRLESRFGAGPAEAGKLSVINGKLSYADLAARPRDIAYGQASDNAKNEILCAFGVPESVLGNASERTYSNAQAEGFQFWSSTMIPTLSRIADAFLPDLDEDQWGRFNTARIQVLQLPEAERRAEAREEFEKGLRSVKSYMDLAGYGDEVDDTPYSRALWIPSGRTPMPSHVADAAALGAGGPAAPEAAGPGAAPPTDGTPGVPADGAAQGDTMAVTSERPAPAALPPGTGGAAGVGASATTPATPVAAPAPLPAGPGTATTKALALAAEHKAAPAATGVWTPISPPDTEALAAAAIRAAILAQTERWASRAAARLRNPRARKGTRHFTPSGPADTRSGTKALDAAGATDADGFADAIDDATRTLIHQAALLAAAAWLTDATGDVVAPADLPEQVADAARGGADAALPALVSSAAAQARRATDAVADIDSGGGTLDDAVQALDARHEQMTLWAEHAADNAAGSATEAGYAAAARHYVHNTTGVEVQQQWITRKDTRVRDSHDAAHGQMRDPEKPFNVGEALLRYPRDPLAPASETVNCRCRTLWRQRRTGRFTSAADTTQAVAS